MSSAQKRIFFLQRLDPESIAYNMPFSVPLSGDIQKEKLETVIKRLIERHESLRTSFRLIDAEPVQIVHDHIPFRLEFIDTGSDEAAVFRSFVRPFDPGSAPLMRSALFKREENSFIWLVDVHHIISDGTSQTILEEDFSILYNDGTPDPPELKVQYKDFSIWQDQLFGSGAIKPQWAYWLDIFADSGDIEHLRLPGDRKRPERYTSEGDRFTFKLERGDADRFRTFSLESGGTVYMNMLAVLNALFYRYSGQEDVVIGTGIAGRHHADLERIMGMFVNTLACKESARW